MKLQKLIIKNFRCFDRYGVAIDLEKDATVFIGANGTGKTSIMRALSCLFGLTTADRAISKSDFHSLEETQKDKDGHSKPPKMSIYAKIAYSANEFADLHDSYVPEMFKIKGDVDKDKEYIVWVRLTATFEDDAGDGVVNKEIEWTQEDDSTNKAVNKEIEWIQEDDCTDKAVNKESLGKKRAEWNKLRPADRSCIQFLYVPANRNASSQVAALLKSNLWKSISWPAELKEHYKTLIDDASSALNESNVLKALTSSLSEQWSGIGLKELIGAPSLKIFESDLDRLMSNVGFAFNSDGSNQIELNRLSDGQRSLFHIALLLAMVRAQNDVMKDSTTAKYLNDHNLSPVYLSILGLEEPENNLSPFYLSQILTQVLALTRCSHTQALLSTHSPAVMSRIDDPQTVRYLRDTSESDSPHCTKVKRIKTFEKITEENKDKDKSKAECTGKSRGKSNTDSQAEQQDNDRYVRLAVKFYPELYFAKFVVLCEGDSERFLIPSIAKALGVYLDPSFVSVVPINGRHPQQMLTLLNSLQIPHATLLDLDLGRMSGGIHTLRRIIEDHAGELATQLSNSNYTKSDITYTRETDKKKPTQKQLESNKKYVELEKDILKSKHDTEVISKLQKRGFFFSQPIDIDFSMLKAFEDTYQSIYDRLCNSKDSQPKRGRPRKERTPEECRKETLKEAGHCEAYGDDYDRYFALYPKLFLDGSKPGTHQTALTMISAEQLAENAPTELKYLIAYIAATLKLPMPGELQKFRDALGL